jgi:hypothetical protein
MMKLYDVNFFILSQRKPKRKQPEVSNANVNDPSNQSSQVPQVNDPTVNDVNLPDIDPEFEALAANLAAAFEASQSQPNVASVMASAKNPPLNQLSIVQLFK